MTERGTLRRAVHDWRQWYLQTAQTALPRSISGPSPGGLAKALTGVRRSGKTFTAVLLSRTETQRTFYFNFEDPVTIEAGSPQLIDELLELHEEEFGAPTQLILDEIQEVPQWERWVGKAVDLGRYRLTITGSSSRLLDRELATAIAGRVIEHHVWPLSFAEYLQFTGAATTEAQQRNRLRSYLKWGGFPLAALLPNEVERVALLKQYLQDIVLRDVVHRHQVRDGRALDRLVAWYLTNVSCLHSYQATRKAFGGSIEMISTYTAHLAEAFLMFEVQRYHLNLKVQSRDAKKIYLIDNGLRTVSLASDREDWGRLAENAVFLELRRRDRQVFYFKGVQETDFLITELGKPRQAIQVAYSDLSDPQTRQREVAALMECLRATRLKKGTVLTTTADDRIAVDGCQIDFMPLHRFLLRAEV
jgi:predicted AAA+ superfamily ATPase